MRGSNAAHAGSESGQNRDNSNGPIDARHLSRQYIPRLALLKSEKSRSEVNCLTLGSAIMIVRIIFLVLLLLATGTMVRAEEITVAAAISLKESLEAIRPQYESSGGDRVKFTFASSGQLVSQVQNGAPIDLFLSAARKQVDDLRKAGSVD